MSEMTIVWITSGKDFILTQSDIFYFHYSGIVKDQQNQNKLRANN
jgi:hypothetical protein